MYISREKISFFLNPFHTEDDRFLKEEIHAIGLVGVAPEQDLSYSEFCPLSSGGSKNL